VVAVLFAPIIPVTISHEVPYEELENYEDLEPYEVEEEYWRDCRYNVVSAVLSEHWDFERGTYWRADVTIQNTDTKGATFSVHSWFYDNPHCYEEDLIGEKTGTKYIAAGQEGIVRTEFDWFWGEEVYSKYLVHTPRVKDTRTVTKYRTVVKQRLVTKYRTEYETVYKSIIEILIYGV